MQELTGTKRRAAQAQTNTTDITAHLIDVFELIDDLADDRFRRLVAFGL